MKTVNNIFKHTFFCLALGTTFAVVTWMSNRLPALQQKHSGHQKKMHGIILTLFTQQAFPAQLFTAIRIRTMHTANIHGNRTELFISKTASVLYMTKAITSKQSANKTFSCRK